MRRYQNPDGTLTSAGKKRYSDSDLEEIKKASSRFGIIGGLIKKRQIDKRNVEAEKEASKTEKPKDSASKNAKPSSDHVGDGFSAPLPKDKQSQMFKDAKEKGLYDMTFLEITQNDYYANHFTKKDNLRMLQEYKKYLENGGKKYWEEIHKDESNW